MTLLSYLVSPFFALLFGALLILFHPIQIVASQFGPNAIHASTVILNRLIMLVLSLIGTRFHFSIPKNLPSNRPLIIISNHQSMFDTTVLLLGFQKHHPKFIAKKELLRWVPSVSIYLRHSGAAVIDRKSGKEAVTIIAEFGKALTAQNASACIFPEGTRTRDGKMKPFKIGGVAALLSSMPKALVVPVAISGTYALTAKRFWPVPVGARVTVTALQPIEPHGLTPEEVVQRAESQISSTL